MRRSLAILCAALVVPGVVPGLVPGAAQAQSWPSETIRIVVGFTPGGSSDLVARILAPLIAEDLGATVIIENRPGAASTIAAEEVSRAAPDGHTWFLSNVSASSIAPFTYPSLGYDPVAGFDDASILGYFPAVLLADPNLPITTLDEFVAYVRARPGEIAFGTGGLGTMNHISGELLNLEAGLDMEHIAYRGSAEATNDMLAGVLPFQIDALTQNVGRINDGVVRALAITTPERSSAAPDVPTFAEQGFPGVVAYNWVGLSGPAGIPADVMARFHAAVDKAMNAPEVIAQFETWGMFHMASTPAEAEAFVAAEIEKWREVVTASGAFN